MVRRKGSVNGWAWLERKPRRRRRGPPPALFVAVSGALGYDAALLQYGDALPVRWVGRVARVPIDELAPVTKVLQDAEVDQYLAMVFDGAGRVALRT
jgi:hypothetical protein